jgi:hypothetical protein
VVLESASVTFEERSPQQVYSDGLDAAKLLDSLNFELHGKKTHHARDWRRKYSKFEKKVVKQEA